MSADTLVREESAAEPQDPSRLRQLAESFRLARRTHFRRGKFSVVARGAIWVLIGVGASKVVRAAMTLVLARWFLSPMDFGLVALMGAFLSGVTMLSDVGLDAAVVRSPQGDHPEFVDTAYLIQALRGVTLWAIAASLAYPFAAFYHQPLLHGLVIVGALDVAIRGFTSGSVWSLARGVRTDKLAGLTLLGDAAGFAVAITWAAISPTAWALVAGTVASALTYVTASHIVAERPVRLSWNRAAARQVLFFGAGMFLSSATYFLVGEGQRLALAKFISMAEFGCFALALSIATVPDQLIGSLVSKVFFPVVSRTLAENPAAATGQFKKIRLLILALSACMVVGFIFLGRPVAAMVLGPKYRDAGWMLQLLGVRAALQVYSCVATYMLFAIGFSKYAAFGNLAKLVHLAVGLTIAFALFGFKEAVWVIALAPISAHIPLIVGLARHSRGVLRIEILCGSALLTIALLAGAVIYLLPILEGFHP